MLVQVLAPQILSSHCHVFSAVWDPKSFDPERTPGDLGIEVPERLRGALVERQAEFVAGRFSAMDALKSAGCKSTGPILINPDGSPLWPTGYVGSITHSNGYVSAVVAEKSRVMALGRDSERMLADHEAYELQKTALNQREIQNQAASGHGVGEYVALIFSAKESLYKALCPIVGEQLDYPDAEAISISREPSTIRFRLSRDLGPQFPKGMELLARYEVSDRIHTAVEYFR
jgi:enterobactin synthetase component D